MSRGTFIFKGVFLLSIFVYLSGCGTELEFSKQENEQKRVDQAVENLKSGAVIEQLNNKLDSVNVEGVDKLDFTSPLTHANVQPSDELDIYAELELSMVGDACKELGFSLDEFVDSPEKEFVTQNAKTMGDCLRELFQPFVTFSHALSHYKDFKLTSGVLFSQMTKKGSKSLFG